MTGPGQPRGRRRGAPDTRAAILAAARAHFASAGFSGTTIRAVARDAGVDPALVHHYFGSKDDLFLAALEIPFEPAFLVQAVAGSSPEEAPERLFRTFLSVWDDPHLQPRLVALARSALDPTGPALFGEGILPVVVAPVVASLGVDQPERRIPLLASQMIGVILLRYVLQVEPLASMSTDDLVATYVPTLRRYLTMPLP